MTKFETRLVKLSPFAYILGKTKTIVLPGFDGVPLYDVMQFFRRQITKIGFASRTAAISFNALMALPAGMIFLCTIVPYLPAGRSHPSLFVIYP